MTDIVLKQFLHFSLHTLLPGPGHPGKSTITADTDMSVLYYSFPERYSAWSEGWERNALIQNNAEFRSCLNLGFITFP